MTLDPERLRRINLFADLDYHDLGRVASWATSVHVDAGQVLFEQGSLPWDMLVIERGTVEVLLDGKSFAMLGPGDPVGEMSLLMEERRMATARAVSAVDAIAIPADDLVRMQDEMPEIVDALREVAQERRRRNLEGETP